MAVASASLSQSVLVLAPRMTECEASFGNGLCSISRPILEQIGYPSEPDTKVRTARSIEEFFWNTGESPEMNRDLQVRFTTGIEGIATDEIVPTVDRVGSKTAINVIVRFDLNDSHVAGLLGQDRGNST